nr:hypothetical protein 3 [Spirochaetaceae bacterium]
MIYRLLDRLHTVATRRKIKKLSRELDELTGGDRDQKIAHHVGELMTLIEIEATRSGEVVEMVVITPDEEEGYHYTVEYKDVEVET